MITTRGILSHVSQMLAPNQPVKPELVAPSGPAQNNTHWVEHGNTLREAGDVAGAVDAYRRAIAAGTFQHQPYLELGHLYRLHGQRWAALESYVRAATASRPPLMIEELTDLEWFDRNKADDRDAAALRASITTMLLHAAAICTDARLACTLILPVAARSCEKPILEQLLSALGARGLASREEYEDLLGETLPPKALELACANMPTLHSVDTQRQVVLR